MKPHTSPLSKYFQRSFLIVLLPFILCYINPVKIQAQGKKDRPAVALVLSGGGAHGIAHLGVIMVMEEAGLRPDYITGVSMGSIIGGLYSVGYSPYPFYVCSNRYYHL